MGVKGKPCARAIDERNFIVALLKGAGVKVYRPHEQKTSRLKQIAKDAGIDFIAVQAGLG